MGSTDVVVVGAGGTLGRELVRGLDAVGLEFRADRATAADDAQLAQASVVVNAAGPRVRPGLRWTDYFREHVGIANHVARSMKPHAHLVHISSTAVYGARTERLGPATKPEPERFPSQAYACAKLAAEMTVLAEAPSRGVAVTVLRPSMVYGPGIDSALETVRRLAHKGIALRFSPGRIRQHLVHIDLLRAVVRQATTRPTSGSRVLVVADPFVLTNEDLFVPDARVPLVVPVGWLAALHTRVRTTRLPVPLSVEALAVLGLDNEFLPDDTFRELGIDATSFDRRHTFDPYWRSP